MRLLGAYGLTGTVADAGRQIRPQAHQALGPVVQVPSKRRGFLENQNEHNRALSAP